MIWEKVNDWQSHSYVESDGLDSQKELHSILMWPYRQADIIRIPAPRTYKCARLYTHENTSIMNSKLNITLPYLVQIHYPTISFTGIGVE